MNFSLNEREKSYLLRLARDTIEARLENKPLPEPKPITENLKIRTGAFVTINKRKQLRGCIGYVEGIKPLYLAIPDLALSAAFNDPRFSPLTRDELPQTEIEISVLTPLTLVNEISEIQIGRDGLLVKKGFYEGLLLPQVATEYGWDVETFLRETCIKAGLPPDAWKDPDTQIFKFSALIFSETNE